MLSSREKRAVVVALRNIEAVKPGDFTLSSGIVSPVYADLKHLPSHPKENRLVIGMMERVLLRLGIEFDHLAGIPLAGLPQASVVAFNLDRNLIYLRKEAKEYGTKKLIEGTYSEGETVVILDDVITSGGTILGQAQKYLDHGLVVKNAIVVVDREQGGAEALANKGIMFESLITLRDIEEYVSNEGRIENEQYQGLRVQLDY